MSSHVSTLQGIFPATGRDLGQGVAVHADCDFSKLKNVHNSSNLAVPGQEVGLKAPHFIKIEPDNLVVDNSLAHTSMHSSKLKNIESEKSFKNCLKITYIVNLHVWLIHKNEQGIEAGVYFVCINWGKYCLKKVQNPELGLLCFGQSFYCMRSDIVIIWSNRDQIDAEIARNNYYNITITIC